MDHKPGVLAGRVDRRVDCETGRIDEIRRLLNDGPFEIDLHQRRGRHLLEIIAVGIDQEMMFGPGYPGRDMGEDHVVPPLQRDQSIEGRQIDPDLPFLGRYPGFQGLCRSVRHARAPALPPYASAGPTLVPTGPQVKTTMAVTGVSLNQVFIVKRDS